MPISQINTNSIASSTGLTTPTIAQINSAASLTPTLFYDNAGVQVGTLCRAWVNYKGTATRAINASFNVTSVTFNATGDYTINFTNAISDANYCVDGTVSVPTLGTTNSRSGVLAPVTLTTTTLRIQTAQNGDNGTNPAINDYPIVSVAVFR